MNILNKVLRVRLNFWIGGTADWDIEWYAKPEHNGTCRYFEFSLWIFNVQFSWILMGEDKVVS